MGGIKENIKLAKGLECDMYKRTNPLIMTLPFVNPCNLPTLVELPFRSSFHPSTVTFNPSQVPHHHPIQVTPHVTYFGITHQHHPPSPCDFFSMLAHPPCPPTNCHYRPFHFKASTSSFVAHMFCPPFHIVPTTPHCFSTHTLLKPFTTIILLLDLINQKQLLQVVLEHAIHLQVCALPDLEGIPSTLVEKTTRLLVLGKLGCRN